jgi:glycosyltransferase involved in cell wall biosynthesis
MRAKVKLLGFRRDIFSILETTDIYVQPSVKEGLGKTIMEAMICRCATIVTDSGGPSEIVENNKSGLVVEKENSMALKEALIFLLDNREEMIKMQKAANRRICTHFTMEAMFEGLKKQYMELISA